MPDLVVYTDGGARGNPGPAAIGIVVCDASDRPLREHGEAIGRATNNEAEYRAVIRGLELAAEVRRRARPFAKVRYRHRPRREGHLRRADELVNEALDAAGF